MEDLFFTAGARPKDADPPGLDNVKAVTLVTRSEQKVPGTHAPRDAALSDASERAVVELGENGDVVQQCGDIRGASIPRAEAAQRKGGTPREPHRRLHEK
jgi:hypothetical protein